MCWDFASRAGPQQPSGDDPLLPPQTSVVETKQAVLETREEAVFKRMLHPLQTVHIKGCTPLCANALTG